MKNRLPKYLRKALDETGLPWEVENGRKHLHIRIAGRLAHVHSNSGKDKHQWRHMVLKDIKRCVDRITSENVK